MINQRRLGKKVIYFKAKLAQLNITGIFFRYFLYTDKIFANNFFRALKAADIIFINHYNRYIGQWQKDSEEREKRLYIYI